MAQILVPARCAGGCGGGKHHWSGGWLCRARRCRRTFSITPLARTASTRVSRIEWRRPGVGKVLVFDIQGWVTLILGGLLALITLFASYSHVHVPFLGAIALDQQIGVLLLAALVPALVGVDEVFSEGVAQLATRCRLRVERDRVQAADVAVGRRSRSSSRARSNGSTSSTPKSMRSCSAPAPTRLHPRTHPATPRVNRLPARIRRIQQLSTAVTAFKLMPSPPK